MTSIVRALICALSIAGASPVGVARPEALSAPVAAGQKSLVNTDSRSVALQGYDPVAYFTESRAVKGAEGITASYGGGVYRFASAEHKQMFEQEPAKYAPQFGGYCGYAASINRLSPIDPEFFQIIDGRLVLQHNKTALDKWNKDLAGNLAKADANWPGLVARNGSSAKTLVNTDKQGVAVQGYDVVAYFTDGKPAKGDPQYEAVYAGARYHFVSMEHRVMFETAPAKYAPAYGGHCGYAASINKLSPVDPELWQIVDERLVLQHSKEAYDLFNKRLAESVAKADANWPGLVKKNGK